MSYVIQLHLSGQRVVIIGGGDVATRKAADLAAEGAEVIIISPQITPALQQMPIRWIERPYAPGRLAEIKPLLVIITTDNEAVNAQAVAEARQMGILVNRTDGGDSTFSNMITAEYPPLVAALSSGNPVLSQHLRDKVAALLIEYQPIAQKLAAARPKIKQLPDSRQFWQKIRDALSRDDMTAVQEMVDKL